MADVWKNYRQNYYEKTDRSLHSRILEHKRSIFWKIEITYMHSFKSLILHEP